MPHVRLGTLSPPADDDSVRPCYRSAVCDKPGYDIEIFTAVVRALGWTFEFVHEDKLPGACAGCGDAGHNDTSRWTGLIGALARAEVDAIASTLVVTPQRSQVVDYAYPIVFYDNVLIYRMPNFTESMHYGTIYEPFPPLVWLAIGIVLLVLSAARTLCLRLAAASSGEGGQARQRKCTRWSTSSYYYVRGGASGNRRSRVRSNAAAGAAPPPSPLDYALWRLYARQMWNCAAELFAEFYRDACAPAQMWIWFCVLIRALYQCSLSSQMAIRLHPTLPLLSSEQLPELLRSNRWHLKSYDDKTIPYCRNDTCDEIRRALVDNPMRVITERKASPYYTSYHQYNSAEDALQLDIGEVYFTNVLSDRLGVETSAFVNDNPKHAKYVIVRDDAVATGFGAFTFQKGSKLLKPFNNELAQIRDMIDIIISHGYARTRPLMDAFAKYDQKQRTSISMKHLGVAFIGYEMLCLVATNILLVELLVWRYRRGEMPRLM